MAWKLKALKKDIQAWNKEALENVIIRKAEALKQIGYGI